MKQEDIKIGEVYYYEYAIDKDSDREFKVLVEVTSTRINDFHADVVLFIKNDLRWSNKDLVLWYENIQHPVTKETHPEFWL